jgi:hypothetical protein
MAKLTLTEDLNEAGPTTCGRTDWRVATGYPALPVATGNVSMSN